MNDLKAICAEVGVANAWEIAGSPGELGFGPLPVRHHCSLLMFCSALRKWNEAVGETLKVAM